MKLVHVLVEGQTEEVMVRDVLAPFFSPDIWPEPSILKTKKPVGGAA
jgi:hypothetical protein